jgi:hypothetical protein
MFTHERVWDEVQEDIRKKSSGGECSHSVECVSVDFGRNKSKNKVRNAGGEEG